MWQQGHVCSRLERVNMQTALPYIDCYGLYFGPPKMPSLYWLCRGSQHWKIERFGLDGVFAIGVAPDFERNSGTESSIGKDGMRI